MVGHALQHSQNLWTYIKKRCIDIVCTIFATWCHHKWSLSLTWGEKSCRRTIMYRKHTHINVNSLVLVFATIKVNKNGTRSMLKVSCPILSDLKYNLPGTRCLNLFLSSFSGAYPPRHCVSVGITVNLSKI